VSRIASAKAVYHGRPDELREATAYPRHSRKHVTVAVPRSWVLPFSKYARRQNLRDRRRPCIGKILQPGRGSAMVASTKSASRV
jgi:hypothetical protein